MNNTIRIDPKKFLSDIEELWKLIGRSNCLPDNIYGIPRGGIPVALELSRMMHLPIVATPTEGSLIVDDLVDSGETLKKFPAHVTAVLYKKPHSPEPSFHVETLDGWIEFFYEKTEQDMEDNIRRMLEYIGEDPNREGLKDTPKRVIKMYNEVFGGYKRDESELFKAVFTSDIDSMVVVKDMPFYSHCEHHLVPFFGTAHIGYIPNGKVLGLSKFARLVRVFAKRLQIQERLTVQVADAIEKHLAPKGVMVILEAQHLCMSMRGVRKPNTKAVTSVAKGAFKESEKTRAEFMRLVYG